jgi:Protein of unknown function (DUF3300)
MKTLKQVQAVVVSVAMAVTFVTPTNVLSSARAADLQSQAPLQTAPTTSSAAPTPKELQQLVAPIALYPDGLVAQVLAGSTNPTEVVEADRWLQENKNLKGSQLMAAVDKQPWDPSIKGLTEFPSVLHNMSVNLTWTSGLGDAYFNDPNGVMAAIQALRKDAQNAGNLKSTPQQTVTTEGQSIVIAPANPEVVYVPTYSPAVVYGTPIAAYPGYSGWDVAAASALSFGVGAAVGAAFNYGWGWRGWGADWHGGSATFNRNNYVSRSNTFVNRNTRYNQAVGRAGQLNRANINRNLSNRNLSNRSAGQFNRPNYQGAINQANRMKPQSLSASRGFGNRDRSSIGARNSAFGGFDRGGAARMNSARGHSSFSGGGFRGGGGGFRGGGGGFRGGGGRGGGGRGGGRR